MLKDCVVMPGATIQGSRILTNAIIGEHTHIGEENEDQQGYQTRNIEGVTLYGPETHLR